MREILLSIIVPVYNVEKYILKCLDSIIPQLTPEVELIVVDDCTPDHSGSLAQDRLSGLDANVTYYRRAHNGGLSAARNSGLELAKGKFCWFVDSDDFIAPNALETITAYITQQETDLLIFNHQRLTESGESAYQSNMNASLCTLETPEQRLAQMCTFLKNMDTGFSVWRRIYSLDVIRQNDLRFEPNKEIFAEDICFNLYYLNYCKRIDAIEACLYFYLLRNDSIMGNNQDRPRLVQMQTLAKKVFEKTPYDLIRQSYHLIYAAIMGIHYSMSTWQDLEEYAKNTPDTAFACSMCESISKNFSTHLAYYGKRNAAMQYCYAKLLASLFQRKPIAKWWYRLTSAAKKI